mgnify:CR=1 FL=1
MVFKNIAGFLKRNAETIMLVFILICVLGSTALAVNYDVVYPCEDAMICNKADLYDKGTLFARVELLNKVEPIQEGIRIKDCDLFDCRVKIKITPTEDVTINNNNKIEGWFEYNKKLVEFIGIQILVDDEWQELDLQGGDKYDMLKDASYTFGIDYKKHNVNDSVDLVPVIFGASIDQWAWWIPNYYYRLPVELSNTGVELTDYQVRVTGVDINEAIENGTYMRWTWLNETSGDEQQVAFWRSDGNHSETAWDFSTASGDVWVRTPLIPVGTNTSTLYLYYSDPVSGIGWDDESNPDDTFYFYDNCSSLSKWTNDTAQGIYLSSGRCIMTAASAYE